jgi:radical SAM superfamily enzyme YgiQ (UPF0313 family)
MKNIRTLVSNKKISVGIQSGSNEILKKIKRGHTIEEGIEAINILIKAKFIPVVDFIFGLPIATEEDEFSTIKIIKTIVEKGAIVRAHIFMPLPGTALEQCSYQPLSSKIKKIIGKMSTEGKIQGNWTHQEDYVKSSWELSQKVIKMPPIIRNNNF